MTVLLTDAMIGAWLGVAYVLFVDAHNVSFNLALALVLTAWWGMARVRRF